MCFRSNMRVKLLRTAGMFFNFLHFSTAIAIRGKDCVVFAVENIVTSKLYEPGCVKRIYNVDKNIGMVSYKIMWIFCRFWWDFMQIVKL